MAQIEGIADHLDQHGYANTSTREIAERAGIADNLLFRHFGSKAQLFEAAVADTFKEFVVTWTDQWATLDWASCSPEEVARAYVSAVYELVRSNRDLIVALLAVDEYELQPDQRRPPLADKLTRFEAVTHAEIDSLRATGVDVPILARAALGMVLGIVVFDGWLFPPGTRRPSRQRIEDELVALIVHGTIDRPPA